MSTPLPVPTLLADFAESDRELRCEQSLIGAWLMLALIPAGSSLDYFVYPGRWLEFALYRAVADVVVVVALVLHWHPIGRRHPSVLIALWLGAAIFMICAMIYVTDGARSTYYEGLVLALMAIGILLPLDVREAAAICIGTLVLYSGACLAHGGTGFSFASYFNNIYFLVLATIISITAVHFNHRRRFAEFSLRRDIEIRNRQLSELDRMKSQFFASVSHELRTPLTLILAPVQDLLRRIDSHATALREPLDTINSSALRLLRLVDDLLDLVRFEQSDAHLELVPVDITTLLGGLVDQVRYLATAQKLNLESKLPAQPLIVKGDAAALERIFINLLSNAIKFTEPGGRIEISASETDDRALVTVKDTGIGLAPENISRIFGRFQQVNDSSVRRHQGLGLGLALVKELVERHGGRIDVSSKLGQGTEMRVTLQRASGSPLRIEKSTDADGALASMHRAAMLQAISAPSGSTGANEAKSADGWVPGRATVLIVDDEMEMQRYLCSLVSRDFNVLQAFDGEAALESIAAKRPDLVLLDLMLPKLDGLEVCRRVKRDSDLRATKIILLTARVDEEAKLAALERGADDFLTKPFSGLEVVTRLRNLERAAKLECEIRKHNVELEGALRRLREAEAQLLHSEKLNSLGTMAAGLLHEINNPLNYAGVALGLALRKGSVEAEGSLKELLNDVNDGLRRVQAIVSDLRAFATPRALGASRPFSVATIIQHALRFTASELSRHSVSVDVPDRLLAAGNEQQVTQVVVNLLLNAARACELRDDGHRGRIEILVKPERNRVVITVKDNGCGIPEERLSRIFDPFYTTSDVGEGMGLGLSISHAIVKHHGGTLSVRTREGEGSEFSFDLATETAHVPEEAAHAASI